MSYKKEDSLELLKWFLGGAVVVFVILILGLLMRITLHGATLDTPQKLVAPVVKEIEHPVACALTAPSHSKLMSEFTDNELVKDLYNFASSNQYPIVTRLGIMYSEGNKQDTVLFMFIKDNSIDFKVQRLLSEDNHNIILIEIPNQTIDKALIDLLKK